MSKNSREYTTLIKATNKLTTIVKNNITPLCADLVSRGLITTDQQKSLRNPNHEAVERAADLIQLVADKVELDPKNYYEFVEILAEEKSTYGDVLCVLEFPIEPGPGKASTGSARNVSTASGIHLPSGWYLRVCLLPITWITSGVKITFRWLLGRLMTLLSLFVVAFILQNVGSGGLQDLGSNTTEATPYINKRLPLTHDLPRLNGPFIGRDKLISNITRWLHQDNVMIIAIFGPPAIGKSSLGIHIGHIMLSKNYFVRYIDTSEHILFNERFSKSNDQQSHAGMQFLQLAVVQTWKFMLQVYNVTKGILIPSSDLEGTVNFGSNARTTKWLKLRKWAQSIVNKTLLLLDNCDIILNDDHEEFLGLLEDMIKLSNFNLKILLTSQIEIKLVDNFVPIHLEGLHPNDSVKLLNELVQGYGTHFEGQDAERIAELVDNFPLALKVIGSVLRKSGASSAKLVQELEQDLLKRVSDRDQDKDNFTAIMDIAYSYLSYEVQNCSHYLSLLIHSFDKNAARKI